MTEIEYDPIKVQLAKLLGKSIFLRRLFHLALDLLFLRAWYVRREFRTLKDRIRSGAYLLDAGMGFGQYSDRMLRTFPGARLVGMEIDTAHYYGAKRYFDVKHPDSEFVLGDVQKLPLRNNLFDLVLSVDVMEHIPDDEETLKEFNRVLRPGGVVMIHTPRIRDDLPFDQPEDHHTDRWTVGEHVRDGYLNSELRSKLEAAGLRIVKLINGYGKPGMIAWTLLQRIPLSMIRKGWLMVIPTILYLMIAIPVSIIAMWLDLVMSSHSKGGSVLVIAEKPVEIIA